MVVAQTNRERPNAEFFTHWAPQKKGTARCVLRVALHAVVVCRNCSSLCPAGVLLAPRVARAHNRVHRDAGSTEKNDRACSLARHETGKKKEGGEGKRGTGGRHRDGHTGAIAIGLRSAAESQATILGGRDRVDKSLESSSGLSRAGVARGGSLPTSCRRQAAVCD